MNLDLEGYLRSDVYSTLANKICRVLVPLLRKRYTARLEIYLVEDNALEVVVDVWTLGLQDRLPVIPVPLRQPDPDVPLDLMAVLNAFYDEAAYDLSIDYRATPPPPPLSESDTLWLENLLAPLREE